VSIDAAQFVPSLQASLRSAVELLHKTAQGSSQPATLRSQRDARSQQS
jgi:hypothetical protein